MGRVMVSVRAMVAVVMSIVVMVGVGDRRKRGVKMRLGREMDGNETDVGSEQQNSEQPSPPAQFFRWAVAVTRSASASHQ